MFNTMEYIFFLLLIGDNLFNTINKSDVWKKKPSKFSVIFSFYNSFFFFLPLCFGQRLSKNIAI